MIPAYAAFPAALLTPPLAAFLLALACCRSYWRIDFCRQWAWTAALCVLASAATGILLGGWVLEYGGATSLALACLSLAKARGTRGV